MSRNSLRLGPNIRPGSQTRTLAALIIGGDWRPDLACRPDARVDVAQRERDRGEASTYVSMTVLISRGVVMGSAWRCTIFQASASCRKIMVARSEIGVMFPLPVNRAWTRSI